MQFTRLRLNGFKSFVDPTDLVISAGLTGIVGPNGCGKSNLLEALRWIMGENRAKQMRGDGMDDVIFAGTAGRPARNSATVELVLDNSERLAPAAFNQTDQLEISRRITRQVGSAYRINGKDVRARDIQMLFADASTGAHSPALVRQGQIAELIGAKPKARRRVLEEAAGISGLYQRRHEAELKLVAAETNLERLQDVLDQLSQRLGALERQAAQARRYRQIAETLRQAEAVLLLLRWRLADDDRRAADGRLTAATRAVAAAEGAVVQAAAARQDASGAIPPLREEETIAAAVLQRLTIEGDQLDDKEARAVKDLDALASRSRQLTIDTEREEALQRDAGATLTRLSEEQERLAALIDGQADAQEQAAAEAQRAGDALSEQETKLDSITGDAARLAARHASLDRMLTDARSTGQRLQSEIDTAEASASSLDTAIEEADAALSGQADLMARTRAEAGRAEEALDAAEAASTCAQQTEAEARAARSDAQGEVAALAAEVTGLRRLLDRDADGEQRLVDRIDVDPGFEAAIGAALGDDLEIGLAPDGGSGWVGLEPYAQPQPLPAGIAPVTTVARGPDVLARRFSQTGLAGEGTDGDRVQPALGPGQRLVSRAGDLWRWDGYRRHAGDSSSAAALRLEQRNRLTRLCEALERAETLKTRAEETHAEAKRRLGAQSEAESAARQARRTADQAASDAARAHSRAESDLVTLRARLGNLGEFVAARTAERTAAEARSAELAAEIETLADLSEARRNVELQRGEVDLARTAMLSARSRSDEIRRAGAGRKKRLDEVEREQKVWLDRQGNAAERIGELTRRREDAERRRAEIAGLPEELAARRGALAGERAAAQTRRDAAATALAEAEAAARKAEQTERDAERIAGTRREDRARHEAELQAAASRVAEAAQEITTTLSVDPADLATSLGLDTAALPPVATAEADTVRLRRQRDALGSVNLRADEDAETVRTERDDLSAEKADLEQAISTLRRGIAELNREGRARLLAAFESVNERFSKLFQHLFGGGEARLIMVESEDPLDAGLEILCQPPGKKLSTLSLLSGGEQTLTALSLIFAVFLSNPSPICVLDEVDAPLDDSNVNRFCDLLDEMGRLTETRFLIITHHAITMSRMHRLFGVTMVEQGVSQLVSVDLARAAVLVDA